MFGFGRKSEPPQRPSRGGRPSAEGREKLPRPDLSFLGYGGGADDHDDGNDDELEKELLALVSGGGSGPSRSKPRPKPADILAQPIPTADEINKYGESDAEEDDEDINDSDLEAELSGLVDDHVQVSTSPPKPTPPPAALAKPSSASLLPLLQDRLTMYQTAHGNAKSAGDTTKARRYDRAIKSINDMIKSAKTGRPIDEDDIPPVVSTAKPKPPPEPVEAPQEPAPAVSPRPVVLPPPLEPMRMRVDQPKPPVPVKPPTPEAPRVEASPEVLERLHDLKRVAVVLKKAGDLDRARQYLMLSKALDTEVQSGNQVDLTMYPLPEPQAPVASEQPPTETIEQQQPEPAQAVEIPIAVDPAAIPIPDAPPEPKTVMEALTQRLDKYKSEEAKAKEQGNSSKARRMGRIVKQYEDAIKAHQKGKPVQFDELPAPPGYGPIPGAQAFTPVAIPMATPEPAQPSSKTLLSPESAGAEGPSKNLSVTPKKPSASTSPSAAGMIVRSPDKPIAKLTLQEKQLQIILDKQHHYREAALLAKKQGDLNQARDLLRTAKGFDKLIQASKCGLPVDMATLPSDPQAMAAVEAEGYEVVGTDDCIMPEGDIGDVYTKLEEDLRYQMKTCMKNRDHFRAIGDIASANRFEKLAIESKRDLDTLRLAAKQGNSLPTYRYETRVFTITEVNTDLQDDDIEISILSGINIKVPNPAEIDTFVKIELPYPSNEEAQRNKTAVVYNTNNPTFDAVFKMQISRQARSFPRFIHRHGIKLELWSKGGFLRSNSLLGTGTMKLLGLETKCTIHEAVDILEGRKNVGKIEVKVRVRDPILAKQITQRKEKWLSIVKV